MSAKHWIAAALALTMCLPITAQAAEKRTAFTDVPAGSWFEESVALCAGNGIMIGTGADVFSPQDELTGAQCLTLALRLYDTIRQGGDGTFLTAPEEWGKITLTNADGTVYTNHGAEARKFGLPQGGMASRRNYALHVVLSTAPENIYAWQKVEPPVGPATLNIGGEDISGTTLIVTAPQQELLAFQADTLPSWEQLESIHFPSPGDWWRDTFYTAWQWGLNTFDTPGFDLLLTGKLSETATREDFARALADAVGSLPVLCDEVTIPDVTPGSIFDDGIYALYRAGILNGIDEAGTFGWGRPLTRAEAAAMVARVIEPSLRIGAKQSEDM